MAQLGSGEKFDELQERETQLFEKHGAEWFRPFAAIGLWPLRGTVFDQSLFVDRGLIETIFVFETGVLPRYADELHQAAPAISMLWLSTRDADIPATVQIPWMNQISHLRLRNEREFVLSDEDLYAMVDSSYLGSLEIFATDSGHVTPESQQLSGDGMGAFCVSNLFSQLRILDMDYLEGEASARLSKSTKGTRMTYLDLKMSDFDQDASFSGFRDSLQHMHLTHSKIDPTCLNQMVSGKWPNLLHLNMTGTKTADEGATIIAEGEGLSELQYLSLANTNIGLEGAKALASSPNLQQLKQVMLSYESVGEEGVAVMKDAFSDRATFC